MNLLLVVSVVALGLQATAARRIAAEPEPRRARSSDAILRVDLPRRRSRSGSLLLLLTPLINAGAAPRQPGHGRCWSRLAPCR